MTRPAPPEDGGFPGARIISVVGAYAFALVIFVFLYAPILDQDIWWHLKSGWYILTEKTFPRTNTFSYASDAPWIDHQWLFQILVYKLWEALGPNGIIALKVTVGSAAWAVLASGGTVCLICAMVLIHATKK